MNWVTKARVQVKEILSDFSYDLAGAAKETAVELLCEELKKIPVPFVGTILSKAVKESLKSKGTGSPGINDVLEQLQRMQLSDDDFLQGLDALGEDVERLNVLIDTVIKLLEETKSELTVPKLIISDPDYRPNYPQSDNELLFCLMNIGGGAVKVPEIYLEFNKWEPETKVVYTVPAAPPIFLRLKVELSPGKSSYPLLQLNNQPFRRFGARSEGAEDIIIQMSSEKNALYHVRIRIPYKDIDTDQVKELVYPSLDKEPLLVSFPYAPGWDNRITPDNMLERGVVLTEIINTFSKAKLILEATEPSDDAAHHETIDKLLAGIGFYMGLGYLPEVLNRFIPPVARMIEEENRPGARKVIFELVHQSMRYSKYPLRFEDQAIDSLCNMGCYVLHASQIREFFKQQNEQRRLKILTEIFDTV